LEPFYPCATQKCKERCVDDVCHSEEICLEEVESLRQQLAIAERTTDEVQRYADGVRDDLRQQLAECQYTLARSHANWTKSDKELAECQAGEKGLREKIVYALSLSSFVTPQKRVLMEALAMQSDSTALDTMLAAAELKGRREALLEAIKLCENERIEDSGVWEGDRAYNTALEHAARAINNMAKELE
jgi:hypothetical protein